LTIQYELFFPRTRGDIFESRPDTVKLFGPHS
jgi:hypothetical protein